jgi:hypothetical protein
MACELCIIACEQSRQNDSVTTPSPIQHALSSTPPSPIQSMLANPPVRSLNTSVLQPIDSDQTLASEKRWPDVYTLPILPNRLKEDLQAAESLAEAEESILHRLIQILFEDMSQFTL